MKISKRFSRFQHDFPDFGMIFQIPTIFFRFQQPFFFFLLQQLTEPTDTHPHPKPTRPIFLAVGFGFLCPSTRRWRVEFGLGPKPTRPDLWIALTVKKANLHLDAQTTWKKCQTTPSWFTWTSKWWVFFFFSDLETSCRRWRGESIPNEQMLTCLIINLNS